jgi:ABC-type uncharacterized transport system permease subunit
MFSPEVELTMEMMAVLMLFRVMNSSMRAEEQISTTMNGREGQLVFISAFNIMRSEIQISVTASVEISSFTHKQDEQHRNQFHEIKATAFCYKSSQDSIRISIIHSLVTMKMKCVCLDVSGTIIQITENDG